ncbi:hypothetical protein LTR10_017277 [Elasticomyces elasticus]|uniref:Uncharacterized protein n=1 Tax=Exophiala sideris TaxID=1016849 RepID=A0ABR0JHT6_9EURO|nr:hypothetical protein LTR10_017277 [Elasticomyces elasticus]KAK5034163.1 hypothetical protein LTS07_003083 [Exophiala sideris]KAK5042459.1 hypothetical protein LTR13_001306 [Exophiala sideris]KAK5065541.1 hypothetical protein LTR69_003090 [Exophiala sideris]KAK5186001.1 hypothetical protein LTR44_002050 [Eurotiomycetes sp. CCFEE 6388]
MAAPANNAPNVPPLVPRPPPADNRHYLTIEDVMSENTVLRPTRTCFRISYANPDLRPGNWTKYDLANRPDLNKLAHVIFVFQRHSGDAATIATNGPAACAIVGARVHEGLRWEDEPLQGKTLIILMVIAQRGVFPMPAYRVDAEGLRTYSMFVETMEALSNMYWEDPRKPRLWFVSRSMSSVTTMVNIGWTGFLRRFSAWQDHIALIYQVHSRYQDGYQAPNPARRPEWTYDPVYPIKWMMFPLRRFVAAPIPQLPHPAWWQTVREWLQDEYDARTGQMPIQQATGILKGREYHRLQID